MRFRILGLLLLGAALCCQGAQARITKLTISSTAPAFGGATFGAVGAYTMVTGIAYGEVDPHDRRNVPIQDIALAPRNAKGMVEYSTHFQVLMPADAAKGSRTLLFEIVNRGRTLEPGTVSTTGAQAGTAGDGFLETQGFTMVWAGWQADLTAPPLPAGFDGGAPLPMFTMTAPIATDHGNTITGKVRAEWILGAPASTQEATVYPAVSLDNAGLSLTARVTQNGAHSTIANSDWAFADCSKTAFPGTPDPRKVCLKNGFDTNHIYELVYTAKDPIVMGLGLAAIRDVGAFFRRGAKEDGNVLAGRIDHTMIMGVSQSGRLLRSFLNLGFNEDEQGRMVYEGAQPHIAAAGAPLNVRFAQPGRLAGTQHTETQYPGTEIPPAYGALADTISVRRGGLLEACGKTNSCPKIVHTMTDTEYWQSSGRVITTDAAATRDVAIPDTVRIYQFSSAQHGGRTPTLPLPAPDAPRGACEQMVGTNSFTYDNRAVLVALQQWVANGTAPPPSRYSRLDDGTLVPLGRLVFPKIPGVSGPGGVPGLSGPEGVFNTRFVYTRGARFDGLSGSGIIDIDPPRKGARYPSFVPQVDADGNDVGGVRTYVLQAPLGTNTGWNGRREGFSRGDSCDLVGSYIPFTVTAAERAASGDPRLSLEERYHSTAGYVKAVTAAVDGLVAQRLMLASDREDAIRNATAWWTQASKGKLP